MKSKSRHIWPLLITLSIALPACVIVLPGTLEAQTAASSGEIVGQLLDSSGAAVAGAQVTIKNKDTNYTRDLTADGAGRYAASNLPLGPYEISAKANGLEAPTQLAFVTLGSSVSANFTLKVVGRIDSVNVGSTEETPGIEPTRSAPKSILTDLQIHELPSNGRRLQNFVIDTPQALIEPECRGFSISGQKGIYANISIDGGDYDSTWGCGIRARSESAPAFSLGAVQEIQVVRNTFSAEFGRTTGGVIQLSTKSGTNEFHATALELFRNHGLAALDAFGRPSIYEANQFGGSIGGPIQKDKTFFFVAPEFQLGSKPVQVIYATLDSQNQRNSPGAQALLGVAPEGTLSAVSNAQSVISRVDHSFSDDSTVFARFDFNRTLQTNSPGATNLSTGLGIASTTNTAASNQLVQPDTNYTLLGEWTYLLSSTNLNELRVQFSREIRPRIALGTGPQVTVMNAGSTVGVYGTPPAGSWGNEGFASTDNRYQVVENFSKVSGAHTMKLGVDYQRLAGWASYDGTPSGAYTFSSLTNYLARNPAIYTQSTGSGSLNLSINELGAYIQDEWRVLPGLTINPGFRYDAQFNPNYFAPTNPQGRYPGATSIPNDTAMFAPRLGVAWDIGNAGKTVVRAGGGFFYAPTYMSLFANDILFNGGNPDKAYLVNVSTPGTLAAAFQNVGVNLAAAPLNNLPTFTASQFAQLIATGTPGLSSVYYMDPKFQNPRALQWQASVERQIDRGITVSENFTYINTVDIARERDTNLGVPVLDATGRDIYSNPRPLPAFSQAITTESAGRSLYRGFTTTLNVRRTRYTMDVYYTRSWNYTYDDSERGFTSVRYADVNNIKSEYNYSNIDEPNQFLVNGNYSLPLGFEIGTTMRFTSGRPFNAVTGTDSNLDGNTTDRPILDGVLIPRNAYRNKGFKDVSLRVQKTFTLPNEKGNISISAEMFNLFNFANVQLAGQAFTYGNTGTVLQSGSLVQLAPQATFGQLKSPTTGQYYQSNAAGDPFQAQLGLRFQF